MLISKEVSGFSHHYIYTISPLFMLERDGSTISMTVAGSADGWYDRYLGYYVWDGDIEALLGSQGFYDYQQYDRPLDAFVQDTLTPGEVTAGSYSLNYGAFEQSFGVVIFDDAADYAGTYGHDYVFGSAFDDRLSGGGDDDGFEGGDGDDVINGGAGADLIDGGAGSDTASYAGATAGVEVHLVGQGQNKGDAAGDNLIAIENIVGSRHADSLHGDGGANRIIGGGGSDFIFGRGGKDLLDGGRDPDALFGGAGRDLLRGGVGGDILDGGSGIDTASYNKAQEGVSVSLTNGMVNRGEAAGDILISIENLTGSRFDDRLFGDDGANVIDGGNGSDTIRGKEGPDVLSGGRGMDTFVFDTALDGVGNVDVILDYAVQDDRILLDRDVFAALTRGPLSSDAFVIGSAATTAAQHIIYNDLTGELSYDVDGNGAAGAIVFARVDRGLALDAGEFFVIL